MDRLLDVGFCLFDGFGELIPLTLIGFLFELGLHAGEFFPH